MDPQTQFCHNPVSPARGKAGAGNLRVHSKKQRRYLCHSWAKTFAATKATPFFRLHQPMEVVSIVISLLCHGCPSQAIVAAFGFDERTLAHWFAAAANHCQQVHAHLLEQRVVELKHVPADELWVKLVGRRVWLAMALGGAISPQRDLGLITNLVNQVRACAKDLAILVGVDGLAS